MPVSIRKNPDGSFKVSTPHSVHAKHTTLKKAKAQARLINAVDHGFKPTGAKSKHESILKDERMSKAKRLISELLGESEGDHNSWNDRFRHAVIDDIDSFYPLYCRIAKGLGQECLDEEAWEEKSGEELVNELLAKATPEAVRQLVTKMGFGRT